jgi:hypothetical protein
MKRLPALFAALCFAPALLAQSTVTWDGGGDGSSWFDRFNWSGDALPAATNDVVANIAASARIVSVSNVTARSFQCTGGLTITNSDFTVTAGTSFVNGTLTIANQRRLTVANTNTTFAVNGTAEIAGASFTVQNGARLDFNALGAHVDVGISFQTRQWLVTGGGSVLRFPALTNLTGAAAGSFQLRALSGGRIEFPQLTVCAPGYIDALADGVISAIHLPQLVVGPRGSSEIEARNGGVIDLPLMTDWRDATLRIRATNSFIPTAQISSLSNMALVADRFSPALSNVASAPLSSFYAENGAVIHLPNLATYTNRVPTFQSREFRATGSNSVVNLGNLASFANPYGAGTLFVRSYSGGHVLLNGVTQIPHSSLHVFADGRGSIIQLPALVNSPGGESHFEARNGGWLNISNIVVATNLTLVLRDTNSVLPLQQVTSLRDSALTVDATPLTLSNVTAAGIAAFYVEGGGRLTLPNLREYTEQVPVFRSREFRASGANSVLDLSAITNLVNAPGAGTLFIRAYSGGQVLLTGLTQAAASTWHVFAEGAGSVINLANLLNSPGGDSHVEARSGGTLNFPNLLIATKLNLVLRGTNSSFQLAQLTSLANSALTVDAVNLTLANVTDISLASFYVENGGRLFLPNATTYPPGIPAFQNREFRASGAGSVLDLSSLTSVSGSVNGFSQLYIRAYGGGTVLLSGITTLPTSVFHFWAEGGGSAIQLPNLTTSPRASSYFEARGGGTIHMPQLTRAEDVQVTIRGSSTLPTAQWVSLSNSVLIADAVAPDLNALTNADLAGFYVENGGRLTLPNITRYTAPFPSFFTRYWQASGAASVLELTNLTEVSTGPAGFSELIVRSLFGGEVLLPRLGRVHNGNVRFYSERTNSVLRAEALTNWSNGGSIEAAMGGRIELTSNTLVLTNVTLTLRADATNRVGAVELWGAAEINGNGQLLAHVLNGGRVRPGTAAGSLTFNSYTQATNGALLIEIGGTTPTNGFDVLNVVGAASLEGQLEVTRINNFAPALGSSYRFLRAGALSGEFDQFTGLNAGANTEFVPSYDATSASLTAAFSSGPVVTNITPRGVTSTALSTFHVQFNETISSSSAQTNDFALSGPGGVIPITGIALASSRSLWISFPAQATPGTYTLVVGPGINDSVGNPMNQDGDATNGEPLDDRYTHSMTLSIADLAVSNVITPSVAAPGQTIEVIYTVSNVGAEPVIGARTDAVLLSSDGVVGGDVLAGLQGFNQTLATGSVVTVTQTVAVPLLGPAGTLRVVVSADYYGGIAESSEANNVALSSTTLTVPHALQLQLVTNAVEETGAAINAQVSRNGDVSSALDVTLTGDASELSVPSSVTIPAGQNSAAFVLTPVHDSVADGAQLVSVGASASGFSSATRNVTVLDVDTPRLTLSTTSNTLTEALAVAVTVTRDVVSAEPLTVTLASSSPSQLGVGFTVTIPSNQASATFNVTAIDDTLIESPHGYTVTASASNHLSSTAGFTVVDNDVPSLSLSATASSATEGGFVTVTVTRAPIGVTPLTVDLQSAVPARLNIPSAVIIPAGQSSASFTATAVDNGALDGNANVTLHSYPLESQTAARILPGASATLSVADNDGPALTLRIARDAVAENSSTTATVTRNTPATNELLVTLSSSDANEATVPPTVTLLNGQASATFAVTTPSDGVSDGSKTVTLLATATGFSDGTDTLIVTDVNLPDLVITSLSAPTNGLTGENFNITFREMNLGTVNATGSWSQVVFLSTDPYPGDDERLTEFSFSGDVPPGLFVERSTQLRAPLAPGDYWIIVTSDVSNRVTELVEDNNHAVATLPLRVEPSFTATVQTPVETELAGTAVPLTGTATRALGGPAPFELVSIQISVKGTKRVIAALTDNAGNFAMVFNPLPGEAGHYTIGAAHPGVENAPVQDSFTLLGTRFDPLSLSTQVVALTSVTGSVALVNLADVPLSGLSATVLNASPALNASATVPGTLGASGVAPVEFVITSTSDAALTNVFTIRVASAEGVTADLLVTNHVVQLRPRLVAQPGALEAGMRRGGQTIVPFTIVNSGGAETGPLTVLLPNQAFLHLSSPAVIDSIPAGGSNVVTLQLLAATNEPLGTYFGSVVVQGTNASVSVPYQFRSLSDAVGGIQIEVVDEYTYYASGSPRVAGAEVTVRDAISGVLVTNGFAGSNGLFTASPLAEGYYDLEVRATNHSVYRATLLSPAGSTTNVTAFISRQAVRYVWTVEPTEIQDRTKITIESVFETFVPIPVITVTPNLIDLAEFTNEVTQIDLKIENHGLVAAENMAINFGSHPDWIFTPLIREVGTLNARSSITVPLTVRRVSTAPSLAKVAKSGAPCGIGAAVIWTLKCGGANNGYSAGIGIVNARGGDCGGGGYAGAGGSPGGFGHPIGYATPSKCNPCDGDITLAVAKCLFSFMPIDCPGAITYGIFECLIKMYEHGLSQKAAVECIKSAIGAGINCADLVPAVGIVWNSLNCVNDIAEAACSKPSGTIAPPGGLAKMAKVATSPSLDFLDVHHDRLEAMAESLTYPFGSRVWFSVATNEIELFRSWMLAYQEALSDTSSETSRVSFVERTALLAAPRPSHITDADVNEMLDRWNRTLDYYNAGIFYSTNVPFGQNANFIALDVYMHKAQAAYAAGVVNVAEGFPNLTDGVLHALEQLATSTGNVPAAGKAKRAKSGEGICAQVRLRLEQEAVITRDAFRATLELINGSDTPLENVTATLAVKREDGSVATTRFGIGAPTLANLSDVSGSGVVFPNTTGTATWTLIPTSDAAPADASLPYFVSGTLSYRQDGVDVTVPLAPALITVYPNPSLRLRYFHERDVLSDDPFTTNIVEPSQPYSLAVMVQNTGYGAARNMRIASSQPQIIENEKGLLIDFDLIATEVAGQNISPSLTVNFGNIASGGIAIGRWLLKSTLQGQFVDYSATFEHTDGLGDPRLSLIESVEIHELIRIVKATNALNDALPDFLVNDFADDRFLPDTLYFSDASTAPVTPVTTFVNAQTPSVTNLTVTLQAAMPGGWVYLRIPDPANGRFTLQRIVRADGVELPRENFWVSDRTFIAGGRRPLYETNLHLLDFGSSGNYVLHYSAPPTPDLAAPSSAVQVLPANSYPNIPLTWSGADATNGSGLVSFDVYVSDNGGPFTLWLDDTTLRGAIYIGAPGRSYAFYTRAKDAAGNVEAAPASADAQTTVTLQNSAPVLAVGGTQSVNEGATVVVLNSATDLDPATTLTFSLGAGSPSGAIIQPSSGTVTWPTGEGTGPSTNVLTMVVTDNGVPPLSATGFVIVVVNEANIAPVIALLTNRVVNEGSPLVVQPVVTDADVPANTIQFSLAGTVPLGASIDANSGLFTWTPSSIQGPSTNRIQIVATDNGLPALSATQSFLVVVRNSEGDFKLSIGSTNLLAGSTSSVPLLIQSSIDITNVTVGLDVPQARLTNLLLSGAAPQLASSLLVPLGTNRSELRFNTSPGQVLDSVQVLAALGFTAVVNSNSAIVPLDLFAPSGTTASGLALTNGRVFDGQVIIIGDQPVLTLESPNVLTLYGHAGVSYDIRASGVVAPWTNTTVVLPAVPVGPSLFYRTNLALTNAPGAFLRAERLAP